MIIKVGNTEFTFDGYYNTAQTISNLAEKCYQQGREDGRKELVDALVTLCNDEPCNYNGMDEFTDDEWCECHCGKDEHTVRECWEHAIDAGWIKRLKETENE